MRNLILILAITVSITSCKKDKLQNCMVGEWVMGTGGSAINLTITDSYFQFNNGSKDEYKLDGNIVSFSNGRCDIANCNGNTLNLQVTSCNGKSGAVIFEGTYTKK